MSMQGGGLVFANEVDAVMNLSNETVSYQNNDLHINTITPEQKEFMEKLQLMFGEFTLKDGRLTLKISIEELVEKYNLNMYDVEMLYKMKEIDEDAESQRSANIYIEDWKLCFEPGDINIWLLAAASAGPEALIAAFEAIEAALGGPIGVVITTIIACLGVANPFQICGEIVMAAAKGCGWYIDVDPIHFQIVHDYIY